jgi:NADPH-dependent FMN reductase
MIATPPRSACVTKTSQQTLKSKIKALNIDTASFSSTLIVQQMRTAPDTGQRSGEAGAGGDLPGPPHSEQKIAEFDGFIICTAEYNHGPPAVLKNALDYAMKEWKHKPVSYVGYGGVGAARAIEHLRLTAIELRMAPLSLAVHIGLEAFLGVLSQGKSLDDYPYLIDARTVMFNQLVWWARALAPARSIGMRGGRARLRLPKVGVAVWCGTSADGECGENRDRAHCGYERTSSFLGEVHD